MKKKKKSIHFSRKGCLDLVKSSVWNIKTVLSHVTQNTVLHKSATVRIRLYSTYSHPFKFIWETIFDVVHYSMRFPARILNLKTLRHPWDLRRPQSEMKTCVMQKQIFMHQKAWFSIKYACNIQNVNTRSLLLNFEEMALLKPPVTSPYPPMSGHIREQYHRIHVLIFF